MKGAIFFLLSLLLLSCTRQLQPVVVHNVADRPAPYPQYSNLAYWAAHPWKRDAADSIPADLKGEKRDTLADVFFIHPTTYTRSLTSWNADINDSNLNAKTDGSSILYQATVFNQHCRVFAPRYRQAHISAFFTADTAAQQAFETAYEDVRRAFEFYLQHFHNNRPIIIAGHSQGGKMAMRLLKEYFDGKPLQDKLVAAYIAGWPVPEGYFKNIPASTSPTQVGCFSTWRTYLRGYIPEYIQKEAPAAYVTNPLTWTTTEVYASAQLNKGSVLRNFNDVLPHTTDAEVGKGVLWVTKPKFPGSIFYRSRNYHIADINLFYINIRQNAEERINAYLHKPLHP